MHGARAVQPGRLVSRLVPGINVHSTGASASHVRLPVKTLTLRVADVTTRVVCDDDSLGLTVSPASSLFLVPPVNNINAVDHDNRDEPDVTARVHRAPRLAHPAGELLFDSGGTWRMYRERDGFVFSFVSTALGPAPYRLARFDETFTRGTISFDDGCVPEGATLAPLDFPLDELLMINLLARGRGVEVHACGVIDRDGSAHVFAGQSGAGKSTIARLWQNGQATVLSDDRLVLRLRDGRIWVYGTPWHGEEEFASPASAPLARIHFLVHGRENAMRRVTDAAAAARLFSCCFPPFHDRVGMEFTLALLAGIVERVPCFELAFLPDPGVVDFVRARA
jgi:hypothetical protein